MNAKYIFIDATFKSAPPHFKQILHIIAIDTRTNLAVLVSTCFMQSKDSGMYQSILEDLKVKVSESGGILEPHTVLCDFEKSIHIAIKSKLPKSKILGCYFHLLKSWWKKASKLGLRTKSKLATTKDMMMKLKILVHLPQQYREEYFKAVQNFYDINSIETKFLEYIQTYYISHSNKSFSYALDYLNNFDPSNEEIIRTNNILEGKSFKFIFNEIDRI